MANKNEKQNKEIVEYVSGKATVKTEKENIRVRFKNSYIGTYGIFYADREYDLDDCLYNLFKDEVEVLR